MLYPLETSPTLDHDIQLNTEIDRPLLHVYQMNPKAPEG